MSLRNATNNKAPIGIPDDLALPEEFAYGGVVATNYTFCNGTPANGYTPGQKMVINVPQEMVSLRDAWLQFKIQGSEGSTPDIACSFVPDIRSIISRMVVMFGSKVVMDIQEFGVLQNIFNLTNDPLWFNINGRVLVATNNTQSERVSYFTDANKNYCCRLNFSKGVNSLFSKVLPLQKIGSAMQIQLYLQKDVNRVISTDIPVTGTSPSFIVNDLSLHYYTIVPTAGWNSMFDEKIQNNNFGGGITFSYRSYDYQVDNTILASGKGGSLTLGGKYSSLLGLIIAFQKTAQMSNFENDKKMNYFFNPGVTTLAVRIGGQTYPSDREATDSDVFGRFLLMFGLSSQSNIAAASAANSALDTWSYAGNTPDHATYVACAPLSKHPNEIRNDERSVITGLDTSIATSVQIDIGTSVNVPEALTTHIWAYYECTITMNPNGSITFNS